ncbi:hypothetical protein THF1A12_80173 [Vibrio jasicida]|uniref:Uncharacterized protein n=1 Tax=Vibrio jasicida TaxID=766224 RepID=A0AAU9QZG8_9VIBR|nr:hypothetical protein THF1A12_80173 [Vibrio jasicida]
MRCLYQFLFQPYKKCGAKPQPGVFIHPTTFQVSLPITGSVAHSSLAHLCVVSVISKLDS